MKRTLAILMVALAATTAFAQRGGSTVTQRAIIPECTATTGTCPSEDYVCRDGSTIYVCDNPETWTVIGDGSNAVHQTGDETIAGTKTFTGSPVFSQSTQVVFGGEAGDTGTTALEWWPFYFFSNATADSAAGVPTTEYLYQFDGSSGTNFHTRWMSNGTTSVLRLEQDGDLLRNDGNYYLHQGSTFESATSTAFNTGAGLGTCSSSQNRYVKVIEPTTATQWPYVAMCVDIDGDGSYYWQRVNEESSAGFIPVEDEAVTTWTAQVGTDNDAVCVAEDVPYACCTGNGTGACTESAWPIGVLSDGKLYGRGSADTGASLCRILLESSDGGESWTITDDLTTDLVDCIRGIYDLGDGEVLVHTTKELAKSTNWGGAVTWTTVLQPSGYDQDALCTASGTPIDCCTGSSTGTCNVTINDVCLGLDNPLDCCSDVGAGTCDDAANDGTFQPWAVDTWGDYVFVTEYVAGGDPVHWENSRYAYLSIDSGATFDRVGDVGLESTAGTGLDDGQKVHIHGTAIDPWAIANSTPRLWWSHHRAGNIPNNAQLYYSDDLGTTWNGIDIDPSTADVDGIQPTTLRAAKYGIVAGTDYEPEGFQRILRRADPDKMQPEMLIELEWEGVSNGFTKRAWRDPRNGIVYDTYSQINTDGPSFVGASDGKSGNVVRYYMPDTSGTDDYVYWGAFVTWASGEDVLVLQIEDNGVYKYETMPVPERGSVPDRLFNKGNLYPPDSDAAHTSTSVGIGSKAESLDSVVVGYRASSTDTAGGGNAVVIGFKASATEPDTVVIGEEAAHSNTSAANSVIIGDNSSGSFHNVIIGSGSTSTSNYNTQVGSNIDTTTEGGCSLFGYQADCTGNFAVAIGHSATAALNATTVGKDSSATTTDCTAIGHTATCDQGRSVALGNDTNTDATDQIAIGDRKITHQSSAGGNLDILFPDTASNRDYTLPDASGTVALTSDIPSSAYVAATHWTNGDPSSGSNAFTDSTVIRIAELVFPHDVQFDTIGIYIQTGFATATTCSVCIYGPANTSGVSSKVACSEGGATATALQTTGVRELSVTEATVSAGLGWLAFACDTTDGTVRSSNGPATSDNWYLKGCVAQEGTAAGSAPATIDLTTESCLASDLAIPWVQLHDSAPSTF